MSDRDPVGAADLGNLRVEARLLEVLRAIKQCFRQHRQYWSTWPRDPDLLPLTELWRELLNLQQMLEYPSAALKTSTIFKNLRKDPKFSGLVDFAVLELARYVHYRERLLDQAPQRPDPDWLWKESDRTVEAFDRVRKVIGPLQRNLDVLTPGID